MPPSDWKILRQTTGTNVEHIGRMLKRNRSFTKQELDDLHSALLKSADTLKTIIRSSPTGKVYD